MRHQFNKIFPQLIKEEENAGKPRFSPDLSLCPNFGHKFFFEVSALLNVRHRPKLQSSAISRKTIDANSRK